MNIKGNIIAIEDVQVISATFQKRVFVIETLEQYKQTIALELHGDKTDIIDAYTLGQEVIADINLRGKSWQNQQGETKYFNTIVCWKLQPSQAQGNAQDYAPPAPPAPEDKTFEDNGEEHDDLPF